MIYWLVHCTRIAHHTAHLPVDRVNLRIGANMRDLLSPFTGLVRLCDGTGVVIQHPSGKRATSDCRYGRVAI